MKSESNCLVLIKCIFGLTIFLFLSLVWTIPALAKDPSAQKTVRVAVKTNVPLTQEIVDELAQYGKVGHKMWKLNIVDMRISPESLSMIRNLRIVQYVEEDQRVLLDPIETTTFTAELPDLSEGCSTWDLDIINVTNFIANESVCVSERTVPYDGEGVYVAVIDTGFTPNWRQYFPEERIASSLARTFIGGPRYIDIAAIDHAAIAEPDRLWEKDTNTHGIVVTASIIGYRITSHITSAPIVNGTAPRVTIIPIKFQNNNSKGWGSIFDVVAAFEYVGSLREDGVVTAPMVINLSSGWGLPTESFEEAVNYVIDQGIIVVTSGGNYGESGMGWPGAYPRVISVGASGWTQAWQPFFTLIFFFSDVPEGLEGVPCEGDLTSCDQSYIWSDSSRERDDLVPGFDQELDIVAPGTRVFAPWLEAGAAANPFLNAPGCDPFIGRCPVNYLLLDGTSIAAPHVAGVAALLLQAKPDLTQEEMECILKHTAIKIPAGSYTDPFNQDFHAWTTADREQGKGLIQADKALDCIGPGGDLSSCGCATP